MQGVQIPGTNGTILNGQYPLEQPPQGSVDLALVAFGSKPVDINLNRESAQSLHDFLASFLAWRG